MHLGHGQKKKVFSTGIECPPADFDRQTLTIKGEESKTLELRHLIDIAQIYFTDMKLTNRPIDLNLIKAAIIGGYIGPLPTLATTVDEFFKIITSEQEAGLVGKKYWCKIRTFHKHINAFIESRYYAHAPLEEVVPVDAKTMLTFLQVERKLSANVANLIVAHLKRILNYALESEYILRNPFMGFKSKTAYKGKDKLNKQELRRLENVKIFSSSLDRIRWVFLFDCYTGLSHIDLLNLTPDSIQYTTQGDAFLKLYRSKSKLPTISYLPSICLDIIERFKNDDYRLQTGKLLPVLSNQKMNVLLKEIAGIAGIEKHLTCHVARHTFLNELYKTHTDEKAMRAAAGTNSMNTYRKHYIEYDSDSIVAELKRNIG